MARVVNYWIVFIISIAVVVWLHASCKTSQKGAIQFNEGVKTTLNGSNVTMAHTAFDWFDGRFNAEVNNSGKVNALKCRVRIRRDSLMWISIKPDVAIIEVFRVLISNDSIKLINYLDKTYFIGDYTTIKSFVNFDISFSMLQNIFTGNPTLLFPAEQYEVSVSGKDTVLTSSDMNEYLALKKSSQKPQILFHAIWLDVAKRAWRSLFYDPGSRMEVDLNYTAYQTVDSLQFPLSGKVTLIGDTSNTVFTFTYTKTDVNKPVDFPFSIPATYQKMK
ncbi:MAG: DUF4292 domain-containing protein [Flavobacteriales bacterium]|nr:DUF4292 domain-containing protein [Flavobacteriales bacterium]